jgi:hypothetical protein
MYIIKVKRRFLPGYRTIKAISYKIEDELNFGEGKKVPLANPRLDIYLPGNRVLVIPDILTKEYIVDFKGASNGSQEIRGRAGSTARDNPELIPEPAR